MRSRQSALLRLFVLLVVVVVLGVALGGCEIGAQRTATQVQSAEQLLVSSNLAAIHADYPLPALTYSEEYRTLVDIIKIQALGVDTTTKFFQSGTYTGWCYSRGMSVSANNSLANPIQYVDVDPGPAENIQAVSQAEPTGLYREHELFATYVVCVNDDGTEFLVGTDGEAEAYTLHLTNLDPAMRLQGESTYVVPNRSGTEGRGVDR